MLTPSAAAELLLETIQSDNEERLAKIARYRNGDFPDPYSPGGMASEHTDLMERAKQPWVAIPGKAVAQTLAVEGFRAAGEGSRTLTDSPEWKVWQRSNLDHRQTVVHHATADYGQAFVLSELGVDARAYIRVLSARYTALLLEDVLSDDNAEYALSLLREPYLTKLGEPVSGRALLWDRYKRFEVTIHLDGKLEVSQGVSHGGNGHNPVTRHVSQMDDDGRVRGEVEPMIPWQDTFNQVLYNLLSTQTDSAFRTIYGTGLKPSYVTNPDGSILLDDNGNPVPVPVQVKPASLLTAQHENARFGVLPGSDQTGYITTLDTLIKQFSALTQTPPNFVLGSMANMSAEALEATEKSFRRKVSEYQRTCGESWERALRVCRVMEGAEETEALEHGEVIWTDFDKYQMVGMADALGKIRENLDVPPRGLWPLIPGVSSGQLDEWARMADEADELARLSSYADVNWDDLENEPDETTGDLATI